MNSGSRRASDQFPSEIKSAINIALFQAQQTYMAAMDTQFAEYKAMFRQEMLTFMGQIRETVQCMYSADPVPAEQQQIRALIELPTALLAKETECLVDRWHNEALNKQQAWEPVLSLTSPPLEAAQEDVSEEGDIGELEATQKALADQGPQQANEQSQLKNGTLGASASEYVDLRPDPIQIPEQNKHQWLVLRYLLQQRSRTGSKEKRVNEAVTAQPGIDPGTDPVVEALYRPRAGGGAESRRGTLNENEISIVYDSARLT
ncbi:hypothetical protein ACLKA7_003901 [Drosophila subpalustris]